MERQKRKEEIQKGLQFIQSPLPFPGTPEEYEAFLRKLVINLFVDGNFLFREGDHKSALAQYAEALNVAEYAATDDVTISPDLLCKLYINRAESSFLLDEYVTQLAQDLAQKLGLRVRKAYVRAKNELETLGIVDNDSSSMLETQIPISNGLGSINDIETDFSDLPCIPAPIPTSIPVSEGSITTTSDSKSLFHQLPVSTSQGTSDKVPVPESIDEFTDLFGEELDRQLDSITDDQGNVMSQGTVPTNLPIIVFPSGGPLLPPGVNVPIPPNTVLPPACFGQEGSGRLNALDTFESPKTATVSGLDALDNFTVTNTAPSKLDTLDGFESSSSLDTLDTISLAPSSTSARTTSQSTNSSQHSKAPAPMARTPATSNSSVTYCQIKAEPELSLSSLITGLAPLIKNPLSATHDFRQACHRCFPKTGPKAFDYIYKEGLAHKCKKDILIGRIRSSQDKTWKRIRPRPSKNNFAAAYDLCKDITSREECYYGDNCTFAYCQEEIDVWTQERKGTLNRDLLFDPLGGIDRSCLTVTRLLQDHRGVFLFLCELCFDSKPRLISKKNQDTPAICSNAAVKHIFEESKCLVYMLRSTTVKYSKIRPFNEHCQFDVCRHEVRYGCQREDSCCFAHSFMELKVWLLQQASGISHEEIVLEAEQFWQNETARSKAANNKQSQGGTKSSNLDLKMKFVCSQCWRNGQVIEPDKGLKYCSAKARHSWTKERRVLLIMSKERKKWVAVRPLPSIRNFPQQYDICNHIQKNKKCQYVGNCTFAHSPEERDFWTYMKESNLRDMVQVYDIWLKNQNQAGESTTLGSQDGEKQIQMPTDYAEDMMGLHCWLCGKNSNSGKQWQQHIRSEKHKEKVFYSEEDAGGWRFRFPMGEFKLCEKFFKGKMCIDGPKCKFAHGQEELNEWLDRKHVLESKLTKARKDMLLDPDDNDFGKYNFLLKELN
ncbi:zinc finger CCCH domain-containing protein 7B [Protopterus annectens]|uniref:zinc finger CCCH domain-containing protein 7B n=1 Tax=Protopterus annectens TaxID=7888 RepID=UPI001CFB4211|nr:zinc finger CCCH domain-containing protein 7B [Protopterus annectens]